MMTMTPLLFAAAAMLLQATTATAEEECSGSGKISEGTVVQEWASATKWTLNDKGQCHCNVPDEKPYCTGKVSVETTGSKRPWTTGGVSANDWIQTGTSVPACFEDTDGFQDYTGLYTITSSPGIPDGARQAPYIHNWAVPADCVGCVGFLFNNNARVKIRLRLEERVGSLMRLRMLASKRTGAEKNSVYLVVGMGKGKQNLVVLYCKRLSGPAQSWRGSSNSGLNIGFSTSDVSKGDRFTGDKCQFSDKITCSGGGRAKSDGTCVCNPLASGSNCEVQLTRATTCSGNGDPLVGGGCTCDATFVGPACQFSDAVTCTGGGNATETGSCNCLPFYGGAQCATHFTRDSTCSGNGDPLVGGGCTCDATFAGLTCQFSDDVTCAGGGNATETGSCNCLPFYGGAQCATHFTRDSTCSGHGDTNATGTCTCDTGSGFIGSGCQFSNATTCNGKGHVADATTGACACDPFYGGKACKDHYTDATTCTGHGTVDTAGACTCQEAKGTNCEYTDAGTCTGHGSANEDGSCTCASTHTGPTCATPVPTTTRVTDAGTAGGVDPTVTGTGIVGDAGAGGGGLAVAATAAPALGAGAGAMAAYPGYSGNLTVVVKGLYFIYPGSSVNVYYDMQVDDPSASGGLHIHVGTTCDAAGGHYYDATATSTDPWDASTAWTSSASAAAVGSFEVPDTYLHPHADTIGHVVVVHAADGTRIACTELTDVADGMAVPTDWGNPASEDAGEASVSIDELKAALEEARQKAAAAKERYNKCIADAPAACDALKAAYAKAEEDVNTAQSKVNAVEPPPSGGSSDDGLGGGEIAGVVIGVLVLVVAGVATSVYCNKGGEDGTMGDVSGFERGEPVVNPVHQG